MENRKRDLYLAIVKYALLNIRHLGYTGRANDCSIEADHVHNIPELIATDDPGKERYYWDVERTEYLRRLAQGDPSSRASFEPLWSEIKKLSKGPELYTIYVPVTSRGLSVFKPTSATEVAPNVFRVLPTSDYDPRDEVWEFPPGSVVECEISPNSFPEMLIAKRRRMQ